MSKFVADGWSSDGINITDTRNNSSSNTVYTATYNNGNGSTITTGYDANGNQTSAVVTNPTGQQKSYKNSYEAVIGEAKDANIATGKALSESASIREKVEALKKQIEALKKQDADFIAKYGSYQELENLVRSAFADWQSANQQYINAQNAYRDYIDSLPADKSTWTADQIQQVQNLASAIQIAEANAQRAEEKYNALNSELNVWKQLLNDIRSNEELLKNLQEQLKNAVENAHSTALTGSEKGTKAEDKTRGTEYESDGKKVSDEAASLMNRAFEEMKEYLSQNEINDLKFKDMRDQLYRRGYRDTVPWKAGSGTTAYQSWNELYNRLYVNTGMDTDYYVVGKVEDNMYVDNPARFSIEVINNDWESRDFIIAINTQATEVEYGSEWESVECNVYRCRVSGDVTVRNIMAKITDYVFYIDGKPVFKTSVIRESNLDNRIEEKHLIYSYEQDANEGQQDIKNMVDNQVNQVVKQTLNNNFAQGKVTDYYFKNSVDAMIFSSTPFDPYR